MRTLQDIEDLEDSGWGREEILVEIKIRRRLPSTGAAASWWETVKPSGDSEQWEPTPPCPKCGGELAEDMVCENFVCPDYQAPISGANSQGNPPAGSGSPTCSTLNHEANDPLP